MMNTELEWKRMGPSDTPPIFEARIAPITLEVSVECGWVWSWGFFDHGEGEVARGHIDVGSDDASEEWDCQGVEKAQLRCESMAKSFLLERVREAWKDRGAAACHSSRDGDWAPNVGIVGQFPRFKTEIGALVAALEASP